MILGPTVYRCYRCKRESSDAALFGGHYDPQSGRFWVCKIEDACTLRRIASIIEETSGSHGDKKMSNDDWRINKLEHGEPFARIPEIAARLGVAPMPIGHMRTTWYVRLRDGRGYDIFELINAFLDRVDRAVPPETAGPRDLKVARVDEHGVAYNAAGESIGITGATSRT